MMTRKLLRTWRFGASTATESGAIFRIQLPRYSDLPHEFDVSKMSQYIQDRVIVTADGNRISEWDVAIRDIELFLSPR